MALVGTCLRASKVRGIGVVVAFSSTAKALVKKNTALSSIFIIIMSPESAT